MTLDDVLANADPRIREVGERAKRYQQELAEGKLTTAEYDALCAQITDLKAIGITALTEESEQMLAEVVQVLRLFLKVPG